jgi:hypothetical protein
VRRATWLAIPIVLAMASAVFWPAEAAAQPRHHSVRAHTGVAVRGGYYRPYYFRPYYFRSYYFSPFFYDPFWGAYGWYPYGPYPPYGWGGIYDTRASVRIQAKPREAQVYVDGYFVGIVDDFDGFSQRLDLRPGEHEIQLYLDGYRTVTEKMLFRPRVSYKIRQDLEKLGPGETAASKPVPSPSAANPTAEPGEEGAPPPPPTYGGRRTPPPTSGHVRAQGFGTLAIRVQPDNAVVTIDGERWEKPATDGRLSVQVAEGSHHVEISSPGRKPFATDVQVRPGEVATLNVSLPDER